MANTKYQIHNQLTGLSDNVDTWEEALALQQQRKDEWLEHNKALFIITMLSEGPNNTWIHTSCDQTTGELIPPNETEHIDAANNDQWEIVTTFDTNKQFFSKTTTWHHIDYDNKTIVYTVTTEYANGYTSVDESSVHPWDREYVVGDNGNVQIVN